MLKSVFARKLAPSIVGVATVAALSMPGAALAASGGVGPGGVSPGGVTQAPAPTQPAPVAGARAKLAPSGLARAPRGAPREVKDAIEAANSIDGSSYCMGGGHKRVERCYDCSGSVSYVLGPDGAGVLKSPLDSGSLERWGERGRGTWITVYTNAGHAYLVIAGLRFDTSQPADGRSGPGWSKDVKAGLVNGPFRKRHFAGL